MRWVSDYRNIDDVTAPLSPPSEPRLAWRDAQRIGYRLLAEQGRIMGFAIEHPVSLEIDDALGLHHSRVCTSLEVQERSGITRLSFDAVTGELRQILLPAGQHAGNPQRLEPLWVNSVRADSTADGQRFLIAVPQVQGTDRASIRVVLNWPALLVR